MGAPQSSRSSGPAKQGVFLKQVYIRRSPSNRETAAAMALAVGLGTAVGAAAYYLTRALLGRELMPPLADGADVEVEVGVEETE